MASHSRSSIGGLRYLAGISHHSRLLPVAAGAGVGAGAEGGGATDSTFRDWTGCSVGTRPFLGEGNHLNAELPNIYLNLMRGTWGLTVARLRNIPSSGTAGALTDTAAAACETRGSTSLTTVPPTTDLRVLHSRDMVRSADFKIYRIIIILFEVQK